MLHWIQYFKGYVTIKVWGYSAERLLNLCGNHDILVWNIKDHGDYHTMNISVQGFFALKPLLKKTGTRAAVLQRYGLPFFVSKMCKRKIFVIGLIGCMLFWILTSGYIWNIKIDGNFALTEDVLLDYLEEQGVHTAMKKSRLKIEDLERSLREDYDLITWTSVQVEGTTLLIHIKENEMPKYDQSSQSQTKEGMDLVATRAGTVSYIITRSGVPQVSTGDTVEQGAVLVSGAVPVYNEDTTVRKYQFVQADADIILRYGEDISVEQSVSYEEKRYTGEEKKVYVLGAGDREWSLRLRKIPYQAYDSSVEKKQVKLLEHLYLPFSYGHKTIREYEITQQKHSEEEMKTLMQEEWDKIISTLEEKGVQIAEKNVTIKKNDKKWVLYAHMQLEESAVKPVPTVTEPVEESEKEEDATTD